MSRRRGRRGRRRPPSPVVLVTAVACLAAGAAVTASAGDVISSPAATTAPTAPSVTGDPRADDLLARMTLAEKIRMLEWVPDLGAGPGRAATLPGVPRLGIPSLRLAYGMPGVASRRPAPGMPSPLSVAATFSRPDAYANGVVIGRDARALGEQVVALPSAGVGPYSGGNPGAAAFGQDPLLAGQTAAAEVAGIQSQGTMAMAGDYPGAGGAAAGTAASAAASPDAASLHEVYLQPFEDAIRAGLAAIMCAPAPGPPAASAATGAATAPAGAGAGGGAAAAGSCGDAGLLMQDLRDEMGFGGFVTSAWGAHPGTLSLNAGLDTDMPAPGAGSGAAPPGTGQVTGGGSFSPAAIRAAIASGSLRPVTIDRAVGTVLAEMDRFGLLGRHRAGHRAAGNRPGRSGTDRSTPLRGGAAGQAPAERGPAGPDARVLLRTAEDSATLLKNENHALPLAPADLAALALIGPGAGQDIVGGQSGPGGWNASGIWSRPGPGPYLALRRDLAGRAGVHLTYSPGGDLAGTPVPASALSHNGQPGLLRTTMAISVSGGHAPVSGGHAPVSGGHAQAPGAPHPPGAALAQNPAVVVSRNSQVVPDLVNTIAGGTSLPAGSAHTWAGELTVPVSGTYRIGLGLLGAKGSLALDGTTVTSSGQASGTAAGGGRGLPLAAGQGITGPASDGILPAPGGLDSVMARVTLRAGVHTLSVTEVPDASHQRVQVRLDWVTPAAQRATRAAAVAAAANARAAVVFAWSTPAAGGPAPPLPLGQGQLIKDVSAVNPDTIVVLDTPGPVALPWFRAVKAVVEMWYPGDAGGEATAGVLLGRADPAGRLPLPWPARAGGGRQPGEVFPFGYGLSYTGFRYTGLIVSARSGDGLTVRFRVTNTGTATGQEVPQVYLGPPARRPAGAVFAPRALAACTRIRLRPGRSRAVTLRVPGRQLQYWDDSRGWVAAAGPRPLYVGPSQRVSALATVVTVPG